MQIDLERTYQAVGDTSGYVPKVASMFGLGFDGKQHISVVPPTTIQLIPGQVVFMTGPSGGGKSTLLRLVGEAVSQDDQTCLLDLDKMPVLPECPLVNCFSQQLPEMAMEEILQLLSLAGLNDAFVMLRKPSELSGGQRYRLKLAQAFVAVQKSDLGGMSVVLADEFGATLDRLTASIIARNVRKWTTRSKHVCFIAASSNDDLLESLEPDLLIEKGLGSHIEVLLRE